jgi:transcriptional regulator with XRE-family HTH domain
MQLAELLKQRRKKTGLSANAAADRAGIGRSYYFEIEQGKRANISLLMAARLSQVLKVSLKDLAAAALRVDREKSREKKRAPARGKSFMTLKERISKSAVTSVRAAGKN